MAVAAAGLPTVRIIVAGVRKMPTPTTFATTIAVAAHGPRRRASPGCGHQNVSRAASCIARGPPDPNTPPAVVTG